jgi:hypothetical protein
MSSRSTAVGVLALLALSVNPSLATIVTLDLSEATFSDGGTASGSMTIDYTQPGIYVLESYNITTTAGSLLPGQTYQAVGVGLSCGGCELILAKNGGSLDIFNSIDSNIAPSSLSGAETSSGFPTFETRDFTAGDWVPEVPGPTVGTGASSFALAALFLGWFLRRRVHRLA